MHGSNGATRAQTSGKKMERDSYTLYGSLGSEVSVTLKDTFPPALFNHKTGPDPSTQSIVQRPEPIPPENYTNSWFDTPKRGIRIPQKRDKTRVAGRIRAWPLQP